MRKNYFIKKAYQTRFIIIFVALLVLEALLISALFLHMSGDTLTTGYSGSHFIIEKTSTFFVISFAIIIFVVAAAMGLAGILLFLFLSHRIAGPLFRFEKTLEEVSKGDLSQRINLRKTDQLKKLQDAFNKAMESLDNHAKEAKKSLEEAHIDQAKDKLSFFKTS